MTEAHATVPRPSMWPVGTDGRPKIRISTNPDAIRVLTSAVGSGLLPDTYVQDGAPVLVEAVSGAGDPTAGDDDVALPLSPVVLRPPLLASLLAEHLNVVAAEVDKQGNHVELEKSPPLTVLGSVLARRSWPDLPVLRRIISTPVLRPDGTLLQQPGYDPDTGFILAGRSHLEPVPNQPTQDDVEEAKTFLLETFLRDFPWVSNADRANYLGMLATPILRPFTRALSPFGVIDATMPGSGKTILSGCAGMLSGQRVLTWTDSDEELRKSITSVLADQTGVVVFDNIEEGHVINSAVLAHLVTERTWTDRKLGTNSAPSFPNDRLWLATGNNLRVGGDMASRSIWVRLDPDCPRPEARRGFTIPNLDTWILDPANQAVVLRHLLVLILDWTAAGAPISTSVPQMRQFTRWAQYLGGFLEHHGIGGFLANTETARDLDDDAAEWRGFLLRWHQLHGSKEISANDLRATAEVDAGLDPWQGNFPTTNNGKLLSAKSLGRKLTGQIGRWRGDIVLRSVTNSHTGSRVYWVERQDPTS